MNPNSIDSDSSPSIQNDEIETHDQSAELSTHQTVPPHTQPAMSIGERLAIFTGTAVDKTAAAIASIGQGVKSGYHSLGQGVKSGYHAVVDKLNTPVPVMYPPQHSDSSECPP